MRIDASENPYAWRWQAFVDFARWARSKPTFAEEERKGKARLAGELRTVLLKAWQGLKWEDRFDRTIALVHVRDNSPDLVHPLLHIAEEHRFKALRDIDHDRITKAFAEFLDEDRTPAERFDGFVEAVLAVQGKRKPALHARSIVTLGSLFNFATAPDELPIIGCELFERLEAALGYGFIEFTPPGEQYRHHLRFATEVEERLKQGGVDVADMIDVQSLILIAADQEDYWITGDRTLLGRAEPDPAGGSDRRERPYLAVCASYRDEAPYLAEWVEFHRLAGVEHFFLYDNGSVDNHLDRLAPYIDEGIVTLHEWRVFPGQMAAYNDCLRAHRHDAHWIAFLDVDTFLFSPTGTKVSELLTEYERWPGVGVDQALYYTSGHHFRPDGLVIENYVQRLDVLANRQIRTIVNPRRASQGQTPHYFLYPYLSAVDENGYPISRHVNAGAHTRSVSFSRLRVNHYYTKSEQDFTERWQWASTLDPPAQPGYQASRVDVVPKERIKHLREVEESMGSYDDTILRYVPALREALARTAAGSETATASP